MRKAKITWDEDGWVSINFSKKSYWIQVTSKNCDFHFVFLFGRNGFCMRTSKCYETYREAKQMAKRLAFNLELEFRQ